MKQHISSLRCLCSPQASYQLHAVVAAEQGLLFFGEHLTQRRAGLISYQFDLTSNTQKTSGDHYPFWKASAKEQPVLFTFNSLWGEVPSRCSRAVFAASISHMHNVRPLQIFIRKPCQFSKFQKLSPQQK